MAGLILQTNMGSMCVQFAALIAPNQDIAFVLAAGAFTYICISSYVLVYIHMLVRLCAHPSIHPSIYLCYPHPPSKPLPLPQTPPNLI